MTNTLLTTSNDGFGPLYYAAGINNQTQSRIFKAAVYNSTAAVPVSLTFEGVGRGATADLTILTADANAMNAVGGANIVESKKRTIKAGKKGVFDFELPSLSVAVLTTK